MSKGDYQVGFGKPPKHAQFKPGKSGNPRGRPRGVKNLSTDIEEELNCKIAVTEGGTTTETTKQRAMIKSLFAKALKGDTRAATVLINLILGLEQTRIANDAVEALAPDDLAILEDFMQRILKDAQDQETQQ